MHNMHTSAHTSTAYTLGCVTMCMCYGMELLKAMTGTVDGLAWVGSMRFGWMTCNLITLYMEK